MEMIHSPVVGCQLPAQLSEERERKGADEGAGRERSWGRMCCWMGRIHTVLIGLGAASFLEEGAAIQPQIWMPQARDVAQLLYELPSLCEDFGPIAIIV